ncbi:hypothetical protein ACFLX3_00900 [Chloroflexota bacterium]
MKDEGEQTLIMENPERPLDKQLPPEKELMHFKAVVRSIMIDASKVLGYIELEAHGAEIEEQISLLDHYLDYTRRLCESDTHGVGDQKAELQ